MNQVPQSLLHDQSVFLSKRLQRLMKKGNDRKPCVSDEGRGVSVVVAGKELDTTPSKVRAFISSIMYWL